MKYKVGDKVIVRKDLIKGKAYGMCNVVEDMLAMCGKKVTIESCKGGHYWINEIGYNWTDEMFEEKYPTLLHKVMYEEFGIEIGDKFDIEGALSDAYELTYENIVEVNGGTPFTYVYELILKGKKVTKLPKTHTITIDGKEKEITHEKYLWLVSKDD